MSSLTTHSSLDAAPGLSDAARQAVTVGLAVAVGAAIAFLGAHSLIALPAAVAALAILAHPNWGVYLLLVALLFPVPVRIQGLVVYPHDGVAILTIFSATLAALRRKDFALPQPCYLFPALALLMTQVLSLINAEDLGKGCAEVAQQFYLVVLAPMAYVLVFRDERTLRRTARLLMLLGTAEALLVCAQFLLAKAGNTALIDMFAFGRSTFRGTTRVFGTIGPAVGVLLVISSFLWINRKDGRALRWSIVALHIMAILATGTRSAMLIFIVTLVFYGLFARKKALSLKMMAIAVAALMIFVGIVGLSRFSERLVHVTDARYRFPIDLKALRSVPQHPLVGHGPKAASEVSISIFGARKVGVENEFVARLYNTGALGLAALFAFGAVPVLASINSLKRSAPMAALAATTAAVVVGIYSGGPAGCIFEGSLGQFAVVCYSMMLAATEISRKLSNDDRHACVSTEPTA